MQPKPGGVSILESIGMPCVVNETVCTHIDHCDVASAALSNTAYDSIVKNWGRVSIGEVVVEQKEHAYLISSLDEMDGRVNVKWSSLVSA